MIDHPTTIKTKPAMRYTCCLLALLIVAFHPIASGQDKLNIKFGKIAPEDFDLSKSNYDTGAAAVVIADIGNTSFEGNRKGKGDFSLVYKRSRRIKVLKKSGFDIATDIIPVYSDGFEEERLTDLKASTYNLENGRVIETKLDDKSIFTDKVDKYTSRKKFTLPAVKEGSIIEISYTITSDFYDYLRSWNFQGEYPILWSEYNVRIPEYFHYVALTQGDQNFFIKTSKTEPADYTIRVSGGAESDDVYHLTGSDVVNRWVKKDVPSLKEESFTTTINNYISRIEFQLHYYQFGVSGQRHDYLGNWNIASDKLLKSEYFSAALDNDNAWMSSEMKAIVSDAHSNLEKIQKIYFYLRDHFTCTDFDSYYVYKTLKSVFKAKSGNVAEINLLLVAMLRHENLVADPMLLSTREHGFASETYPLIKKFNYVICAAKDENKLYYLDASRPYLGFAQLPVECYNGLARAINRDNLYVIRLDPDSLKEQKMTTVLIINDEKGQPSGSFQSTLGKIESYKLREKVNKKTERGFFNDIQTEYGSEVSIENTSIDSLTKLDFPVKVQYDFNIKSGSGTDMIYFNPMMAEEWKENPFKSSDRKYPVEMPYTIDETYSLSMDIPDGYTVDELPKSARVSFNETEGSFEYLIQQSGTGIQLKSRIRLNKSVFQPDEYNTLREFFGFIVKKESEQIVFKKKKV